MPCDIFAQRFHATRVLRDGGDITTFLGTDVEHDRRVVIKAAALDAVSRATRTGLEHQAEVLAGLEHLNVAGPAHIGHDDGRLYVVTPLVAGNPLVRRLQRGALPVAEAVIVGRAVMTALGAAHERGVLHLDVKPSNVMIDESAASPGATLIDFGFSRNSQLEERIGELPAAAAHYLSPEQAGLLHRDIDERSDLYSAGAVLFACLAARPPFQGDSVGDVLSRLVATRAPRLRSLRPDVPRALEQVVERLLQPDPNDRYQSAEAAASDLDEISRALARGIAEPALVVGVRDRGRRTLTEPVLVGRADELLTLEHHLERVRAGGLAIVTLEAESGGGKTRLLEELDELCAGREVLTLRGQGLDQSGQAPYEVLEGVVGGVVTRAAADATFAAVLRERLEGHEAALTAALPRLGELLGTRGSSEAGLEEHGELRTMRALRVLLDALGTADRPALVLLDDCQWADELTLRLLREWHTARAEPDAGAQHVLVVCAFRSEEVARDHPLRRLHDAVSIVLAPFGPADVHSLVDSMTGGLPDAVAEIVARLSEGSPFMATEILRGLVETGVLTADGTGWHAELQELENAQSSRRAAAIFERRLERLGGEVLELLSVGAVLGKSFDVDAAADLAGQTQTGALAGLAEARSRRIVWLQDKGASCAFVHDKLRETLLARLAEADRASLHLAAALHIEQRDPTQVFDIAYHFDAAGEPERALSYALAAADTARRRHALQVADRQYRIA
ncbi:MAG: AAA family ATPase, partial [Actinomycetota bacterium]|nr:AAA family ATPase [Actinomycetota bacterium]